MNWSHSRILTTHVGSLPRPPDFLDMMKARLSGATYDESAYDTRLRTAVAEIVRLQLDCGLDIIADGEMSKPGFFTYVSERLSGFEPRPDQAPKKFARERAAFPEYYEHYFKRAMLGGAIAPVVPICCVGPVTYRGQVVLHKDLENLKAALGSRDPSFAFVPAVAPSGVGFNAFYRTDEEFLVAVGEALRTEYLAIVDSGFLLQIDDPFLSDVFVEPDLDDEKIRRKAGLYIEAINHSLRDIPPEKVRYHTCYGINEGPRIHEASLADVAGYMLRVNAGAYSFEAANCRHEHEYHLWEYLKLPDDKSIIPGVITHASNIVEHPELIAERLERFAKLVGPERVIGGADCGFSSQATYQTEVHPTVIWAKFQALAQGARIASRKLF